MKELPQSAKDKIERGGGQINLNAGSGTDTKPNYINYDINPASPEIDIVDDLRNVEEYFAPDTVTNIICFEVLEHFRRDEWKDILTKLCRLLKKDGRIHIRLPSIPDLVDENRRGLISDESMYYTIYGAQRYGDFGELDYHRCGVSTNMFKAEFEKNGCFMEEANHIFGIGILHVAAQKR